MVVAAKVQQIEATPTPEELVARAHAMIPMLRERAEEVERARSVPADIIEQFKSAGFFKIVQPARWGGYEMSPVVFMRVLSELGRGCCSSAWNMMILGVHNWEFGLMDPRAGDDVWGANPETIIASSYPPGGTVTRAEGGWILNGRWPTSSGCDHGEWTFLGGIKTNDKGEFLDRYAFLVPRKEYDIIDDWHTFGLAGTGSKSVMVKNAFVPEHRAHSMLDYSLSDRGSMYLFPFNMIFYSSVSAVILGFAQGAIDIFIEQMKVRTDTGTGAPTAMSPYVKDRLANAVAKVRSSRARLEYMMAECTKIVERRELVPTEDRVAYMLDSARVGRECEEAVLLLFKAFSARGIFLSNPIQRVVRDTLAAANHITQDADNNAGFLGGMLLGQGAPQFLYGPPAG